MRYSAAETLNNALMSHTPIVIVEGKSDDAIYEEIVANLDLDVEVKTIQEIEGFGPGCAEIIRLVKEWQELFSRDPRMENAALGIIDSDVRPYRTLGDQEIDYNALLGNRLFMLKHYSIETYFATQVILKEFIADKVFQPRRRISQDVLDFVETAHNNDANELYYFSLEALRNACEVAYSAIIGYNIEIKEQRQRASLMERLEFKITDLDDFANSLGLSMEDLKQICKGRWYLYSYFYKAFFHIQQLHQECRAGRITQCNNCASGGDDNGCSYLLRTNRTNSDADIDSILSGKTLDLDEMDDITIALKALST